MDKLLFICVPSSFLFVFFYEGVEAWFSHSIFFLKLYVYVLKIWIFFWNFFFCFYCVLDKTSYNVLDLFLHTKKVYKLTLPQAATRFFFILKKISTENDEDEDHLIFVLLFFGFFLYKYEKKYFYLLLLYDWC